MPLPGFIEPCLPTVAKSAPTDDGWLHEIKFDGYRLLIRKRDKRVRIFSRRGFDFTRRFPRVAEAVLRLEVKSIVLDGEGIVYDHLGMPNFDHIHSKRYDREV